MKSIKIKLQKDEQLTPQFMDLFSKVIINSAESISGLHYDQRNEMKYSQLSEYLTNSSYLKHNGMKSPTPKATQSLSFNFQAKNNNLVFLLDLSPYMLVYNYGSKSFPLKNLQEIMVYLIRKVVARQSALPGHEFNITIYLFSIYQKELEVILLNEQISQNSLEPLLEYINLSIQKSNLPYLKQSQKYGISQLLQNVFNTEESNFGIKALIVISSFNEEQNSRMMLFTPNWYTYAFINTGGHFGSYVVDSKELYRNLVPGVCFKTKYVFQANFLTNWQMTDIIKRQNPDVTKPVTEKFRSIQFESQGRICKDIFQLILMFKIQLQGFQAAKRVNGAESVISVISTIKDNPNKIIYKNYKIPVESFVYILRTRYMQGWQPVMISSNSMAIQNSKFKLRMAIENQRFLFYEAHRVKNFFQIQIYQIVKPESGKDYGSQNERNQFLTMIQKMDKLNSYNFVTLINENLKINYKSKPTLLNSYLFHENNTSEMLNYLCNYRQWGKFFKLKRSCYKFQPQITQSVLEEFINQITFILGKRICTNIFIKQTQVQRKGSEKVEEFEASNRRVMLTKLNIFGNILELEMAFLRCTFKDIKIIIQSLNNKVNGRKFKKGIVATTVPLQIPLLYKSNEICNRLMFNKKWVIKFKTSYYRNIFKIFWHQLLKKMSYEQVFPKNSPQLQKSFYKIVEILNEQNRKVQKITFLKMWEPIDKIQLIFQISIPPSFTVAYSKNKQSKPIFIQQLISLIVGNLKKVQQQTIKIIDTYQAIHYKLLKNACVTQPKALNKSVQEQITYLYDNRTCAFALDFGEACKQIIAKYYSQLTKQKFKILPVPNKFLITTELQQIEGDFNLEFEGKVYNFFLCSPFKFIYLYKKDKNIYYKFVNMYYVQFNHRENETHFIDIVLQSIIYRINEQTYVKDFKIFLGGNYKGGIFKIINNQQFTQLEERKIELHPIFAHCQKYYITAVARGCYEEMRFTKCVQILSRKIFKIIHQFFPLLRVNYYFQIRKKQDEEVVPFQIDTSISRNDTSLFMRFLFSVGNETIDITPQNMPELFVKYNGDIIKNNASIMFKFYLKAKDNSQKSLVFVNYFQETIKACLVDASYEVQRFLVTKRETLSYNLQNFAFLRYFRQQDFKEFELKIIAAQFEKVEILCKYIEDPVMQSQFPFKKVRQNSNEYMLIKEEIKQKNIIYVQQPFLLKPAKGKLWFLFGHVSKFFIAQHQQFMDKMSNQYTDVLTNFINANVLIKELQLTYELPLEPYELWLNESANHPSNKIVQDNNSKKKIKKNPIVSKYLREKKSTAIQIQNNAPSGPNSSAPKIKLSMVYRDFICLNERIPPNKCLSYLGQYQIFNFNLIRNLKNTYFFEKFYDNQHHIIFHFEEKQDQNLIREIMKENKETREIKNKKFLVYHAFCLNPLLSKKDIEPLILKHIQEVLQKQLFDDVTRFLILNPTPIHQFEQSFIKRKENQEKKEFKVELPMCYHRDHVIQYIIQHLQVYHYRVQLKSQMQRQKPKNQGSPEGPKLIESVKYLEGVKILDNFKVQAKPKDSFLERKKSTKEEGSDYGSFYMGAQDRKITNSETASFSTPISSSMIKSTDSFFNQSYFQQGFQCLDPIWLFNCQRPKQSLMEKYGKCLYFLKIKVKQSYTQPLERQYWESDKSTYLFTGCNHRLDSSQIRGFFNSRQSGKTNKRQSANKPMIKFEIAEYVNKPQFGKIQETFNFIVKSCVGQTYLQNYLFQTYRDYTKQYGVLKQQKKKTLQVKQKEGFFAEKVWPRIVQMKDEFQELIDQVDSLLFFKYQSDPHLLMKQKSFYFLHFLEEFSIVLNIIKKVYNQKDECNIPILVYAKCEGKGDLYEFGNLRHIDKLKEDVKLLLANKKVTKIGFITTDYLTTIKSAVANPSKSFSKHDSSCQQPSFSLNDIRFFKDCVLRHEKFKRSALINYQISDQQFFYGSYNIKAEVDEQIKEYLSAVDCWLSHKSRLFSLIKNIKESNIYQVTYNKPRVQKKVDPFYRLRKDEESQKKEKMKVQISMYRMLINLIFNDLPESIVKGEGTNARYKYVHHHPQIKELLATLQDTAIDYKKYQPYKGNEKFQLEKLGREYVSILRQEYMMT